MAQDVWIDGAPGAVHAPDLYRYDQPVSGVPTLGDITDLEVERYRRQGYLVVERAFSPERVQAALAGLLDLVAGRVEGFRGIQFEGKGKELPADTPPEVRQDYVRKLWMFCAHEPRLRTVAEDPDLLSVVSRLMEAAPVMFQDQALLKPPLGGREKPWHQDNAYFNLPPETPVVGVWIALDPALPENGCMHVIPGSHAQGPVVHFSRRDWQICDTSVDTPHDAVVPLQPGGLLLFHGLIHHGTPANGSALRRRALQFHYKPSGTTGISSDERTAVFGSEGKDVTC